jgi:hypothetical protein
VKVKLDENLPARLVGQLARLGHDADTVAQEGFTGKPDSEIWAQRRLRSDFSSRKIWTSPTSVGLRRVRTMDFYWFAFGLQGENRWPGESEPSLRPSQSKHGSEPLLWSRITSFESVVPRRGVVKEADSDVFSGGVQRRSFSLAVTQICLLRHREQPTGNQQGSRTVSPLNKQPLPRFFSINAAEGGGEMLKSRPDPLFPSASMSFTAPLVVLISKKWC